LNFKISNIKCNNLHSILKPQQKKDNQIFFALLIIINKIEQDIIFGIGLNPSFFSKISIIIKGISFSELQSSFIEMYIFEIQNICSFGNLHIRYPNHLRVPPNINKSADVHQYQEYRPISHLLKKFIAKRNSSQNLN
jgi:hypothetical protein